MVMRIGHLTKINPVPVQIYCANCQEQLNEALDIVAVEVEQEDDAYFQNYGTTMVEANSKVKIKLSKPSIIIGQNHIKTNALLVYALRSHVRISQDLMFCVVPHVGHSRFKFVPANLPYNKSIHGGKQNYDNLLREQNQYIANYEDFYIGGVSNEMLSREFEGKTLCGHLELQGIM
eukprot:5419443-Ditylum_brightwellii.AAC.1